MLTGWEVLSLAYRFVFYRPEHSAWGGGVGEGGGHRAEFSRS